MPATNLQDGEAVEILDRMLSLHRAVESLDAEIEEAEDQLKDLRKSRKDAVKELFKLLKECEAAPALFSQGGGRKAKGS